MNKKGFRAYYKGDIEQGKPMLFIPKIIDGEYFFVMADDTDYRYGIEAIFADDSWIVHAETGYKDTEQKMIFENDIVEFRLGELYERRPVKYLDVFAGFGVKIEEGFYQQLWELLDIKKVDVSYD